MQITLTKEQVKEAFGEEEIAKFGSVSEKQKVQKNKNSTQCA